MDDILPLIILFVLMFALHWIFFKNKTGYSRKNYIKFFSFLLIGGLLLIFYFRSQGIEKLGIVIMSMFAMGIGAVGLILKLLSKDKPTTN